MKHIREIIVFLTLLLLCQHAEAGPNDVLIEQRGPTGVKPVQRVVTPGANTLLGFDINKLPVPITIGAGLSLSGNTLSNTGGAGGGGSGSVTSVDMTVPAFLSVSGNPITSTGTFALTLSGVALPITSGGTGAATASAARTALGLAIGTDVQPFSSTLSTWATKTPPTGTVVGTSDTQTLTSKTLSGSSNTFTNLPAAGISGVIPIANLATGTPTGSKFIRDDGTLQPIAGGGDALVANPLSQFAATTSAQLAGVLSDETGFTSGALAVFNINPLVLRPAVAMGALAVDVTKENNTKTYSADSTLTFSATPADGQRFGGLFTNSGGSAVTVTVPLSYSEARGGSITTFTHPAGVTVAITFEKVGATIFIYGDPTSIADLTEDTAPQGADFIPTRDVSAAGDKKVLLSNLGDAITGLSTTGMIKRTGTNTFTAGTTPITDGGTGATTVAGARVSLNIATTTISALDVDWSVGEKFKKTLAANSTFTFSNATDGETIVVALTNTASNYTVTWPTVSWSGGTAPTQTTGAKTDIYTFIKVGTTIYGSAVQNF